MANHHNNIPFSIPHLTHNPFMNHGGPSFDFGELEQAIGLQGVKTTGHDDPKSSLFTERPAATLEMFPSWPMRFQQATIKGSSKSGGESTDSGSGVNTLSSSQVEGHLLEPESPMSHKPSINHFQPSDFHHDQAMNPSNTLRTTANTFLTESSPKPSHDDKRQGGTKSDKVLDAKILRRLAQNREAARKSRLRKKAYVQQLESSRMKLAQIEQDLQRARSQGMFLGGIAGAPANISSGAAMFDMEYTRWLEEDNRQIWELRRGIQGDLIDGELGMIVDGYMNHYEDIFRIKADAAKTDVFHLITGIWTSPAERCFLWLAGFRPSQLIKMLTAQLDPLTEEQFMGICSLQQSCQQAEEALTQGLDQLQQSLVNTIATTTLTDGMHQMAVALGKISNLQGFLLQADNLRQQTLHQLRQILTVRQAARCFLVIGEYYGRLRALSSLWASRPRDQSVNNFGGWT